MEKEEFQTLINQLEGYKTKFREFHWAAETKQEHVVCDECITEVTEFQDQFAESGFSIFGKNQVGELVPEFIGTTSTDETILSAIADITVVKELIMDDVQFCGISAIIDEIIVKLQKFRTLLTYK
jgi:DNA-binding ferritin-like protein